MAATMAASATAMESATVMATATSTAMVIATATAMMATAKSTAFARTCSRKDDDDNEQGRLFDANESVYYFHHLDADSCHGCFNHSSHLNCSESVPPSDTIPPPWVHAFSKSCRPSSQCMQAASIAHLELPVHQKARQHNRFSGYL